MFCQLHGPSNHRNVHDFGFRKIFKWSWHEAAHDQDVDKRGVIRDIDDSLVRERQRERHTERDTDREKERVGGWVGESEKEREKERRS